MNRESKQCQNCHQEFWIEPEDFQFYEKIRVPPPTFCPECRLVRRYAWRNERSLYKAKCDNCSKDIFSGYAPERTFPVFCHDCWYSDAWDPLAFGRDYDFSKPFFEQFGELFSKVPRVHLFQIDCVNSPYSNIVRGLKNGYLTYSVVMGEELFYSKNIDHSRYIFDSLSLRESERCYQSIFGEKDYDTHYSVMTHSCLNSTFLFDCVNASNCFMSSNLRNKQYVLRNVQYNKDEYISELAKIDTGGYFVLTGLLEEFQAMRFKYPRKYAEILRSANATGDDLNNVKNAYHCFEAYDLENVRYATRVLGLKDSMDVSNIPYGELIYEYVSGGDKDRNLKFSIGSLKGLSDVQYSGWCGSSSNLFGCFGLRGKSYCVLNRQYSEGEYKELLPKIIQHMNDMPYESRNDRIYRYGEFFPIELSPFPYNNTVSQEYFPLSREEAEAKGYSWRELDIKNVVVDVSAQSLPDHIRNVGDDILTKIIGCLHAGKCREQCTVGFRIIQPELELYRRLNIALPRLCPNCRHYERLKLRNPWKLWHRKCQCAGGASVNSIYKNTARHPHGNDLCPNEFESPYAPERLDIVYCERCYQQEVY